MICRLMGWTWDDVQALPVEVYERLVTGLIEQHAHAD